MCHSWADQYRRPRTAWNLYFVANYSSQWLLQCELGLPLTSEELSSLNVVQSGEHPRILVVKQMAVECPPARVVRIEC
jgi:hypothetical protein